MIEANSSLLPSFPSGHHPVAICVGFQSESLDEMKRLLDTLGWKEGQRFEFTLKKIHPATYIGQGKVEEIAAQAKISDLVVIDHDLSPNQLRNLEEALGRPVIDRQGVILEIFSAHARTKEAKTQVELARLQYLLPRLAHFWNHFERQKGGGFGNRGMGETQIEVDRRLLKRRIQALRGRLQTIEKERGIQRAGRKEVLKAAFVGYTNAGKSTLMNALTHSAVLAENQLFSTLDSCVRALSPDSHPPVVAIDTVGFISNIPHGLVASFRSTLEELHEADLLVHVVDASSASARHQIETTLEVLKDLGLEDKPRLVVLNKIDQVVTQTSLNWAKLSAPGAHRVSALNPVDTKKLRETILNYFKEGLEVWDIVIPYSQSKLDSQVHRFGSIEKTHFLDKGVFYRVKMDGRWARKLNLEKYRT